MTITELAKELKLSRQSVYNVLKSNGVSIDTLTTVTQGNKRELTAEGVKTIRQLVKKKASTSSTNLTQLQAEVDRLTAELETAKADNDRLTAEGDRLREELDKLREDNSILIKTTATQAKSKRTMTVHTNLSVSTAVTHTAAQ